MKVNGEKMRKAAKGLAAGFLAVCLLVLSGCMESELSEKTLVNMVGIDRTEAGNIKVTLGLISTRKIQLQKDEVVMVYSSEGETIFDAIRHFVQKTGYRPTWPYVKVLVIGPTISRTDVTPILDFFNRNNEIQPNPYVVVSQVPAAEIVNLKTDLEYLPAVIVENAIEKQSLLSTTPQVRLYNFSEMMFSSEKKGFAAIIKKEKEEAKFIPKVEGTAVFKKAKWIGNLNEKETRGVLWVSGQVNGGIVVVPIGKSDKTTAKVALEIIKKNKSTITPKLKNGQLSATIEIKSVFSIGEILGYMHVEQTDIKEIERGAEEEIKKEIEASMQILRKKWKVDLYGFDSAVHKKFPEYWKKNEDNWDSIFSDLPIEVNVTADIRKMGLFESFIRK